MKKLATALVAVSAVLSVSAQEPKFVGRLINVTGLVTIGNSVGLSNVTERTRFAVGDRIVTTGSAGVTLDFDNGCDVTLKENESIKVSDSNDCAALWAAVNPSGGAMGAAAAAAGGSGVLPGVILVGGGVAAIIISRDKTKTSGS